MIKENAWETPWPSILLYNIEKSRVWEELCSRGCEQLWICCGTCALLCQNGAWVTGSKGGRCSIRVTGSCTACTACTCATFLQIQHDSAWFHYINQCRNRSWTCRWSGLYRTTRLFQDEYGLFKKKSHEQRPFLQNTSKIMFILWLCWQFEQTRYN